MTASWKWALQPGARARAMGLGLLVVMASVVPGGLSPQRALGATVVALDLAGLVQRADVIALGQARSTSSRWAKYGKVIVTDVEFAVQRPLKGAVGAGDSIVITTLGGELENLALSVPGAAQFELGRTALVFLRRSGDDLRVVGMAQGVMPIAGEGPNAVVMAGAGEVERVGAADAAGKLKPSAPLPSRPLAEMLGEIARLVGPGR